MNANVWLDIYAVPVTAMGSIHETPLVYNCRANIPINIHIAFDCMVGKTDIFCDVLA